MDFNKKNTYSKSTHPKTYKIGSIVIIKKFIKKNSTKKNEKLHKITSTICCHLLIISNFTQEIKKVLLEHNFKFQILCKYKLTHMIYTLIFVLQMLEILL